MRMSDLIESCEEDFEGELDEAIRIRKAGGKATSRCPNGFVVDLDSGKCIPKETAERNAKLRSKKAANRAMAKAAANKPKSLVDRMKSMFGKK